MKRKYILEAAVICVSLLLCGCGMQKEEEVKNQITIASYDAVNTASEYVKRGDLDESETIFLKLESSQTKEYSFSKSGLLIEKVYVEEGDSVKNGMLLAETENEEIKMNLSKCRTQQASIEENITHYTALLKAAKEKKEDNPDKRKTNLDEISRYELKLAELSESMEVAHKKTTEWQEALKKTQIYADMDGSVEYVGTYGNGIVSDEKMVFIRLGTENEVFSGSVEGEQDFTEGQQISLMIGEGVYNAQIVFVDVSENATMIRAAIEEYVDLTDITYAEFIWNEEHLKDVLYVPTEAVVTVSGEHYVYVYDEKGLPDPKKVEVGKMGSKYTSIVSGLNEGELVELF